MIVRELITKLGFVSDLGALNAYESRAKASADRVRSMFDRSSAGLAGSLRALAGSLAVGLSINGAVQAIDQINGLRTQIMRLNQEVDFDYVRDGARATGQALESYAQSFARVGNAGAKYLPDQESIRDVLDAVAGGLSLSGANSVEAGNALIQFSQALSLGKLRAQEFNSISAAGPVLMTRLAQSIIGPEGTVGGLRELSEKGKLTSEELIRHLRAIAPEIRQDMQNSQSSISAAIQRIKDDVAVGIGDVDRTLNISGSIAKFVDWFRGAAGAVIESLGGIKPIAEVAATSVAIFAGALALIKFPAVLAALASPFVLITAAVVAGGIAIQDFWTFLRGGESIIGGLIGPLETFRSHIDRITAAVGRVIETLKAMFNLKDHLAIFGKVFGGDFGGAWEDYKKLFEKGNIFKLGANLVDVGKGVFGFGEQALANRDQAKREGVEVKDIKVDPTTGRQIIRPKQGEDFDSGTLGRIVQAPLNAGDGKEVRQPSIFDGIAAIKKGSNNDEMQKAVKLMQVASASLPAPVAIVDQSHNGKAPEFSPVNNINVHQPARELSASELYGNAVGVSDNSVTNNSRVNNVKHDVKNVTVNVDARGATPETGRRLKEAAYTIADKAAGVAR